MQTIYSDLLQLQNRKMEQIQKNELTRIIDQYLLHFSLQKQINNLFRQKKYKPTIIKFITLPSQCLPKIIIYFIYRNNFTLIRNLEQSEIINLQYSIKQELTTHKFGSDSIKQKSYFLQNIFAISKIILIILNHLKLALFTFNSDNEIFLSIVYLVTERLIAPKCFETIENQLKLKQNIIKNKHKLLEKQITIQRLSQDNSQNNSFAEFKQELKENLYPKKQIQRKINNSTSHNNNANLKRSNSQSVLVLKTTFANKCNSSHYQSIKHILHQENRNQEPDQKGCKNKSKITAKVSINTEMEVKNKYQTEVNLRRKCNTDIQFLCKTKKQPKQHKKCYSQQKRWSKFNLINCYYVAFSQQHPPKSKPQKNNIDWCSKLSELKTKQKLILCEYRSRLMI